mgnify:CR=1 FL=1
MLPVLLSTVGLGMLPAYRVLMVCGLTSKPGSLLVGMLMHVSLTASLIILRPAATGMRLVTLRARLGRKLMGCDGRTRRAGASPALVAHGSGRGRGGETGPRRRSPLSAGARHVAQGY